MIPELFTAESAEDAEKAKERVEMDDLNRITEAIIGAANSLHRVLGPGLLESTYEACLEHELLKRGFKVERQKALPVSYDGVTLECG